jgi:hypothetical protein
MLVTFTFFGKYIPQNKLESDDFDVPVIDSRMSKEKIKSATEAAASQKFLARATAAACAPDA